MRLASRILIRTLPLVALLWAPPSAAGAARAPVVGDPVRPGVWRLHSTDPGRAQDDLAPLKTLIGKATVVGLGESAPTSGGFHRLKHRVTRYLIERLGFRAIAWESPWIGAERVAQVVATCAEAPEEAIRNLYSVWQSREASDLLAWLCEWNRTHPKPADKVVFTGFDIADYLGQARANADALKAFLLRLDVPADDARITGLDSCSGVFGIDAPGAVPEERYRACTRALLASDQYFRAQEKAIIRRTSKGELALARIHLGGLAAWEDLVYFGNEPASLTAHDRGMAQTLLGLRSLRFPKLKTVVWSGNDHLAESNTDEVWPGVEWAGSFLARSLGKNFVSIALAALDTGMDYPRVECGTSDRIGRDGSLERTLHELGRGDLLVNLDQPGLIPALLPAGTQRLGTKRLLADRDYDLLLYLESSPPMTPLHREPCL